MEIDTGMGGAAATGGGAALTEAVAVRLFLADGRFWDQRSAREIARNTSLSHGHCIAASFLLECALNSVDPAGDWNAVAGRCMGAWHAFVTAGDGGVVADITADQFGLAPVLLKPLREADEFEARRGLSDSGRYRAGDLAEYRRWRVEWMREAGRRRTQARALLDGQRAACLYVPVIGAELRT